VKKLGSNPTVCHRTRTGNHRLEKGGHLLPKPLRKYE
jgi:hypothetical protein